MALRLVNRSNDSDRFYQDDEAWEDNVAHDAEWEDSYWVDDEWSWIPDHQDYYDDWWGDYENESEYAGQWYGEDGDDEQWHSPEREDDEAPPGADGGGPSASSSATATAQESFPTKGRGKGVGCSICGSRWHSSLSCPVNGGGKSGGKGKFSNKGSGNKGYGKGYSKGKSRWAPRGWSSKGKGYYGFSEKTLTQSFGESKLATPPSMTKAKTVHFRMDNEDETVLHLGRHRPQDARQEEGEDSATSATATSVAKRLDFTFASSIYHESLSYHTVLGEKRRGLLVDPGAASGLIGSETLRDLISCLPPEQQEGISWNYEKSSNVSGINGTPEATLGLVNLPLQFSGAQGSFSADVLGGEGSLCPALLSNPALRKQRAAILTDWFNNGDGCLVVHIGKQRETGHRDKGVDAGKWCYFRLLLTDSGHYLLPVDDPRELSKDTVSEVDNHIALWASEIGERWSDVRHCFLELPSRERERYPPHAPPCEEQVPQPHETPDIQSPTSLTTRTASATSPDSKPDTSCTTKSTPTTLPITNPETSCTTKSTSTTLPITNPETSCSTKSASTTFPVTNSGALDVSRIASATSPDSELDTSCTTRTGLLQILHQDSTDSSNRPFLDDRSSIISDTWSIEGSYLVRHHRVPRRILFSPKCALDCPMSEDIV